MSCQFPCVGVIINDGVESPREVILSLHRRHGHPGHPGQRPSSVTICIWDNDQSRNCIILTSFPSQLLMMQRSGIVFGVKHYDQVPIKLTAACNTWLPDPPSGNAVTFHYRTKSVIKVSHISVKTHYTLQYLDFEIVLI